MSDPTLLAVVPVYNHPGTLAAVVAGLRDQGLPVLLVDDGSDAECVAVMQTLTEHSDAVDLLRLPHNGGKGAAVKAGLRHASANGYSHALQIDADAQHDASDLPRFIAAMRADPLAVINGCPQYDESVPRHRFIARYATHVWVWINTLSLAISDSMCGLRIYPLASTLAMLEREHVGDRMEFDTEIIVRLHWQGLKIVNLRTPVQYPEDGVSHFRMGRDNARIAWMHTRLFLGMLWRSPRLLWRKLKPGSAA